jgi:hypothetical protein
MTRKPLHDEAMKNRSVRLTDAEWKALADLGANVKPIRTGPATMVRVAVQEYLVNHGKKGAKK